MRNKSLTTSFLAGLCLTTAAFAGDPCDADLDGSGTVDGIDLGTLLANWSIPAGSPGCGGALPCPSDINGDAVVDGLDLGTLLAAWSTTGCGGGPNELELAGRNFAAYPFFEFVNVFNQGSDIRIAVDPSQHPEIVGQTCRIYIVADQTESQWSSSPTLTDVTGGFQTHAFVAGSIQANTVLISGGASLNGDAGTDLGIGYDVVCDCNQNGQLDDSDFIDGLTGQAGFWVVKDMTLPGPLAVSHQTYSVAAGSVTAGFQGEDLFYPSNIASLGQLPLIVVSHGNGHQYIWYSHIGNFLASYGYIVMSHQNDTMPGPFTASTTTLQHTNAIIAQAGTVAGGVLAGHIDTSRIVWIGHSRGGEGVAIAYDRVFDGAFAPVGWSLGSVRLVVSICPTDFNGFALANPQNANFHLFYTGADADVSGSPSSGSSKPFAIYERGVGQKHVTYLHGAGHGDFHNGGGSSVAFGPDLIGRPATHEVLLGYLLALIEQYLNQNAPGLEILKRMDDSIRPIGINPNVILATEFKHALTAGNAVIDDFETQTGTGTASSGGAVSATVANVFEGVMLDGDGSFDFSAAVPMNGMTRQRFGDPTDDFRAVVFDYNTTSVRNYEIAIVPALQDFSGFEYLSFRAAQGTRHPNTDALNSPLSFAVRLIDGSGASSVIEFSPYGRLTRTYLRTGSGTGAGWCNEYSTVRIRLSDFLTNASGLDLTDIQAVRFEFGSGAGGSQQGRVALDDIELTLN